MNGILFKKYFSLVAIKYLHYQAIIPKNGSIITNSFGIEPIRIRYHTILKN